METNYLKSLQFESLRPEYLKTLIDKLLRRLEHGDEKKEEKYQSKIRIINDRFLQGPGWTVPDDYYAARKNLRKEKLLEIRKDLNNDEGLHDLVSNLGKLKEDFKNITAEIENLVEPNGPNTRQKLYTQVFGKQNDADIKLEEFNVNKELIIKNEIILSKIIQDIETLRDIYKDEDEKAKNEDEDEDKKAKNENENENEDEDEDEDEDENEDEVKNEVKDLNAITTEIDVGCPSFNKEPLASWCPDRKYYYAQARIFHPNNNLNCQDAATKKFQRLHNYCEDVIRKRNVNGGRKQHKKKTRKYFKKNTKTKNTKTKNTKTKNTKTKNTNRRLKC